MCSQCKRKLKPVFKKFKIDNINGLTIYEYDEDIKTLIFQFKGCGDYELKDLFVSPFSKYLSKKFKNYLVLPVPSSKERIEDRGFEHVNEMFSCLKLKMIEPIIKIKNEKQSSKSYKDRLKVASCFKLISNEEIKDKNILLVDDICTTGSTLKAIKNLLLEGGAKKIEILVVAKRDFTKEELEKMYDPSFILS